MVRTAKGKAIPLPWLFNCATTKESTRLTGFNNATWGSNTCSYAKLAHKLETTTRFEKILKGAKPFIIVKENCAWKAALSTEVIKIDDDEDEQACLVDANLDEDCELFLVP